MSEFYAIDPGNKQSAWVRMSDRTLQPLDFRIEPNIDVLQRLSSSRLFAVIERLQSYGMPVGAEIFATGYWIGAFASAAGMCGHALITRTKVRRHICGGDNRAKDATVKNAIIERWGGKEKAVGLKKNPGPLYGMKADIWQAFALGITYAECVGDGDETITSMLDLF